MQELRAFVGHSFSDQDKALVATFLDHFKTLSRLHPEFTWDHAVEAEPSPLSDKVLAKIEGKNVFIGICTKNERAIRDALLRPALFRKNVLMANAHDLQWKASDWIIQEIGLAVGLRMSIILFLEEGVRPPGGLYGNIEYIPFSRAAPHASFDKMLQMFASLTPRESAGSTAAVATEPSKEEAPAAILSGEDWEPKPEWTKEKYDSAALHMIVYQSKEGLKTISDAFVASIFAHGVGRAEWDGRIEWLKFLFSGDGDFEKIKTLAKENPQSSLLRRYVGRVYRELGDFESAAREYELAASLAKENDNKVAYDSDAAIQYAHAGKVERSLEILETVKKRVSGSVELQTMVLQELRELAQIEKEDALELAVLERLCEFRPADTSLRFQLAYKHSQSDNPDMAFFHYMKIPMLARNPTTWNNLGVSFGHFHMPVRSIQAFKRSEQEGETLAMSNLGSKLLSSGFIEEAQDLATKAVQIQNYHANINDLLKRLREVPEEELKKETEALEKVKEKAAFYRLLGVAMLCPTPTEIGARWKSEEGMLNASLSGTSVRFWGSYEIEPIGVTALGALGAFRQKTVRRVEFTLKLRGELLVGEVKRTTDGEQSLGLLSLGLSSTKVTMFLQAAGNEIRVLESSRFYTLTRLNDVKEQPANAQTA